MTPEIKKAIFEFVKAQLPDEFDKKLYWANERKDEPQKPFCLLRALVPEQTDSRTTERELPGNVQEVTMYKNCVITMSVYVDGTTENVDLDVQNAYAEKTARDLKNSFETFDTAYEFKANEMSVNSISELRDLTVSVSGGYTYRYEFDITFGYNEIMKIQKLIGRDVNLQIERKEPNDQH